MAGEASVSLKGMEKKEEVGKRSQEQRSCPHRRMCRKHCVIMWHPAEKREMEMLSVVITASLQPLPASWNGFCRGFGSKRESRWRWTTEGVGFFKSILYFRVICCTVHEVFVFCTTLLIWMMLWEETSLRRETESNHWASSVLSCSSGLGPHCRGFNAANAF